MTKKPENPQAFPVLMKVGEVAQSEGGMTLRDYFAAKGLQSLVSMPTNMSPSFSAKCAYEYADAMLTQRESGGV